MKITMYQISEMVEYHLTNKTWLAHVDFGNDTFMSFFGPTEEAAHKRATDWYAKESERQKRMMCDSETIQKAGELVLNKDSSGQHFAGKVWMIHETTREKVRINPDQIELHIQNGYVRGGPRSK